MKLLVRNLDRKTTEEELTKLFEEFGTVQWCNLVMDKETGSSKGFGFIEMPKPSEANAAVKNINNKIINKSKIRVKKAKDEKSEKTRSEDTNMPNHAED